ncbi:hypothetical protein HMPREF1356_02032 [Enterococcus faecium C1904]|nr:hypothetical protein HMPREF1361_00771 [Enterococcus faecium ERV1]EJY19713.1 hypothetical protein HMPREF1356_02032 [Enterococcus faecium C1904]
MKKIVVTTFFLIGVFLQNSRSQITIFIKRDELFLKLFLVTRR